MSVYVLKSDPDTYDSIQKDLLAKFDDDNWWPQHGLNSWVQIRFALNGTPLRDRWKPIPVEQTPATKRKYRGMPVDFASCDIGNLAISERALEVITPLVGDAIEPLPLECVDYPERRYFVMHVIKLVDCLDVERSEGGRIADTFTYLSKYVFKPGSTEGHHLFRMKQMHLGPELASEEFKHIV
jgi:hypothetical protein